MLQDTAAEPERSDSYLGQYLRCKIHPRKTVKAMQDTNTMAEPVNRAAAQIYLQFAKSCQKKRMVYERHGRIQTQHRLSN